MFSTFSDAITFMTSASSVNQNRHLELTDYKNELINGFNQSKIIYRENFLTSRYLQRLKDTATQRNLTFVEQRTIDYKPELASYMFLGTYGLGGLLMYLNDCISFSEFKDLEFLILPNMTEIENIISEEEKMNEEE